MDPDVFQEHRRLLFGLAYRMLGDAAEAEDVVQDAYLRCRGASARDPKPFLVTVVTRLSIDRLRSARHRRETYVGPWLPEPLVGLVPEASEPAELRDSLSIAFLLVLEKTSPPERAAFLLREVFGYPYAEIAAMLERSEDAVRQLVHRARARLASHRARFEVSDEEHRELLARFLHACSAGDVAALAGLLAEHAVAYTDGGGETKSARLPVRGRERVVRFLSGLARKIGPGVTVETVTVNGMPGALLREEERPLAVLTLDAPGSLVENVFVVAAPAKLRRVPQTAIR